MAKTTHHTALDNLGFDLVDHYTSNGGKSGPVTSMHYATAKRHPGSIVPVVHHVVLNEFHKNPGKYNVSYHVTQAGQPFADGDFDFVRNHKDNALRGSSDPLGDVITHHHGVIGALGRDRAPRSRTPSEGEISSMMPGTVGELGAPMQYFNAAGDWPFRDRPEPLDMNVHRLLTGGGKGRPQFEYLGRISPEDEDTDVYHAIHEDPEDPHMRYGFTIRHMPSAEPEEDTLAGTEVTRGVRVNPILTPRSRAFSYNATHYPTDMPEDDGSLPTGEFQDVTGEGSPVATFTSVGPVLERHKNVLRSLGLMDLLPPDPRPAWHFTASHEADEFDDIINANGGAGPCWSCGKATYNRPEGRSLRGDSSVPINASEETGGDMHGPDINLCGDCASDYDNYHMAVTHGSRGPGKVWHWNDQGVSGCPECEAHLMDQADEDLRP